jgi:hypothetical protein
VDGRGAASARSLPDPDSAFDLNDLSQRSVIALVGLAFEGRVAAGPGVLVVCRGRETADLLQLAISAGCRSIISFGVSGGLAPDLLPGDCVVASAIIDYPAVRPADPLWSPKLAEMIPGARHGRSWASTRLSRIRQTSTNCTRSPALWRSTWSRIWSPGLPMRMV